MKLDIKEEIEIPDGIDLKIEHGIVHGKGPKGEAVKKLLSRKVRLSVEENKVLISAKKATKREKALVGTFKAHIKQMIKGVTEGHIYQLKVCASHFPMSVSVSNNEFIVKNFLGETVPRVLKLKQGVAVTVEGDIVTVESPDKELSGQTAASIEQLCRITDKDRRIFQDGIYTISKSGKEIK